MRTLCVRLDSAGDMVLTGPAIRAAAAHNDASWSRTGAMPGSTVGRRGDVPRRVSVLAGPLGAEAAGLLPGVGEVLVWRCPWIDATPPPVLRGDVAALLETLTARQFDRALIFTSYHQSALPTALLLRLAGVPWVAAISEDYPGSLLDLRHQVADDIPEAERALSLAYAAGMPLPEGDDGRLRVRRTSSDLVPPGRYVVLHPGTSVPARSWPAERFAEAARLLTAGGHQVVVTGSTAETHLTAVVAGESAQDLGGRTDLAALTAVIAGADAIVVGNTGPAHLAAAVGTPVVSLYAPTVPAVRWAPYRVRHILLGDQSAACRNTRARRCPVPGHPCLSSVSADDVVRALTTFTAAPRQGAGAAMSGDAVSGDALTAAPSGAAEVSTAVRAPRDPKVTAAGVARASDSGVRAGVARVGGPEAPARVGTVPATGAHTPHTPEEVQR